MYAVFSPLGGKSRFHHVVSGGFNTSGDTLHVCFAGMKEIVELFEFFCGLEPF